MTAAAMTAPSTNVWNASPMMTSDAALLVWTSHSCVSWQWRHSTSFSSRKNVSTPASSVPSAGVGAMCSSASGSSASSATPSSVPTA